MNQNQSLDMFDKVTEALLDEANKKKSESKYEFDKMRMYFKKDYILNLSHSDNQGKIIIKQPLIGDILKYGETEYYHSLSPFLYNASTCKVQLWDAAKVDWNKVNDIEVCCMFLNSVNNDILNHILEYHYIQKDKEKIEAVNWNGFQLGSIEGSLLLYNPQQKIIITDDEYKLITEYLREVMDVHPKTDKAKGATAVKWTIEKEKLEQSQKADKKSSNLLSFVSSLINHPGFKYNLEDLENMGFYQFMDAVHRIQKYEHSIAMLHGMCGGFVDGKKINKEQYDFMGDI